MVKYFISLFFGIIISIILLLEEIKEASFALPKLLMSILPVAIIVAFAFHNMVFWFHYFRDKNKSLDNKINLISVVVVASCASYLISNFLLNILLDRGLLILMITASFISVTFLVSSKIFR